MPNLPRSTFFAFVKILLCFAIFISFTVPAQAQINNNRFRVDLTSFDLGPCGGASYVHSQIEVLAKNKTCYDLKGNTYGADTLFNENMNGKLPTVGAGLFYSIRKSYLDLSFPKIYTNQHYEAIQESEALERMRFFLIGGYVFNLNRDFKFKPSFFVKQVLGAPLAVDISTNFLLYETLNLGVNYRWDDSISALIGLQLSTRQNAGHAYDYNKNQLNNYNSGTHEIFLRYQLIT